MNRQLAVTLGLTLALLGVADAQAQNVEMVYASGWPKTHVQVGVVADEWIRQIEDVTKGRVKIRHVPGGALLKGEAMLDGLKKRVADCGPVVTAFFPGQLPISATLLASIDIDLGNKLDIRGTTAINNKLFEEFEEFSGEYLKLGVRGLVWVPTAPYAIISRKQTLTMADLQGQKLRGFGLTVPKFESAMGAVPVAIANTEMYSGMQTGIIDGAMTDPPIMVNSKLYEVAKYVIRTGPGRGTSLAGASVVYACNEESWQSISQADRASIMKVIGGMKDYIAKTMDETTDAAFTELEAKGVKISALTGADVAELKKRMNLFEDAAKELDGKGLPGSKIAARYRELAADYLSGKWKP